MSDDPRRSPLEIPRARGLRTHPAGKPPWRRSFAAGLPGRADAPPTAPAWASGASENCARQGIIGYNRKNNPTPDRGTPTAEV